MIPPGPPAAELTPKTLPTVAAGLVFKPDISHRAAEPRHSREQEQKQEEKQQEEERHRPLGPARSRGAEHVADPAPQQVNHLSRPRVSLPDTNRK